MGRTIDETFLRLEFDALWDRFDDDKCYFVTLSQRDISVLVSCLRYTSWPTRWFDSGGFLLRDVGRLSDLETALTYSENLKARLIMACNFDESLERIAKAIESIPGAIIGASCCGPGSGPGYIEDGEGGFWYGTESPVGVPTSFGGPGDEFATEEEFQEHLCLAANNIAAGLILSFNSWSVLSIANIVAGALVVGFFVATPPLALFLALAVLGALAGSFAGIAGYIDANREDFVCAIYQAGSYADFLVRVDQYISEMVINLNLGLFEVELIQFIHAALSTDVWNKAFTAVGLPPVLDPVDCTQCVEESDYYYQVNYAGSGLAWVEGDLIPWDGSLVELQLSGTSNFAGWAVLLRFFQSNQINYACTTVGNITNKSGIRDSNHWYINCDGNSADNQLLPNPTRQVQQHAFFTTLANQAWTMDITAEVV